MAMVIDGRLEVAEQAGRVLHLIDKQRRRMVVQEQVGVALGLIGRRGEVQGNVVMVRKGGAHQGRLARLPGAGHHHRRKVRREPEHPVGKHPGVLHPDIMGL